jgi:hypothetical protein
MTVLVMLAACGSTTPAGTTSPTGTPASGASAAASTPSAVTSPPASAPAASQPGFVGDPDLAAKFPTQVAGKPVTGVTTSKVLDFLTAIGTTPDDIEKTKTALSAAGMDINTMLFGNATATVGTSMVNFSALRVPGQDATKLIPIYLLVASADPTDKLTQETSGGKNVSVLRDSGGYASEWLYANGDILWTISTSSADSAAAVFSALP